MNNNYKQIVYMLFLSLLIPVRAQSVQELLKMRQEYEKYKQGQNQFISPTDIPTIDITTGLPANAIITPYAPFGLSTDKVKHFGYDFFTQRDSVLFWENLPTPSNYLLGSGDELIISLWGETQLRETFIISRDGKI